VTHTALIFFVCCLEKRELHHRQFRSIPRNTISNTNIVDFPLNPDLLKNRTGAGVKTW